ncbi:embryo-specific protein ATS3B-like [Gastrolobium bilobum]|uniref:embryo-specific protein ATS3B-like n=1 Tax=Gastrolobium bilobum TaxID=150636 RepID=UPI002AB2D2D8|nr:embryo-specific protein ATS3B-like [Gastrolobium bilobum]
MMKQVLLLFFCFASGLTLSVSESKSASLQPHAAESFTLGYIQMKKVENCSYLVMISTSCSSPKFTTDEISLIFGDTYGNQVYAPRLDDPISKTFEQCSSDTFQIDGPCASPICYAYLYRSGASNGWKPESVKIYGYNSEPVTFDFNTSIPEDTWYGYNLCDTPPSSSYQLATQKWLICVVIGLVLSFWM